MQRRRPSHDLHQLIRSMTGHEVRWFKLSSARQGGEKRYVELFDAIRKQQVYDEEAIRDRFASTPVARHLSATKRKLYGSILRCLREYHTSRDREIADARHDAAILAKRGLPEQASQRLKEGLSLAERVGQFTAAAELSAAQWSLEMDHTKSIEAFEEVGTKALSRAKLHLQSRMELIELMELNARLIIAKARADDGRQLVAAARNEYRSILGHHLLADDRPPISLRLAAYYHLVRGSTLQYLGEFDDALFEKKRLLTITAALLAMDSDLLGNYLSAIQNVANAATALNRPAELTTLIDDARAVLNSARLSTRDQAQLFSKLALIELQRQLLVETENPAADIPAWITDTLHEYGKVMRPLARFHLCFTASALLALRGNMSALAEWTDRAIGNAPTDSHAGRVRDVHLMQAIAWYELGEYDRLEPRLRTIRRLSSVTEPAAYQIAARSALESIQNAPTESARADIVNGILEEHGIEGEESAGRRNPIVHWLKVWAGRL